MRLKQWTATSALFSAALAALAALVVLATAVAGCVSVTGNDPTLRTPRELLEDRRIEREAKARLAADEGLATNHINVVSYDGIVLLTGEVVDDALRIPRRARLGQRAGCTPSPQRDSAGAALPAWLLEPTTAGLPPKLFSKFAADKTVDASRIKVVAESGVVYLIGVVPRDHADAAAEAARTVFGVRKVVKVFDYL